MFVGRRMQRDLITLSPTDGIRTAMELMRERKLRHIPVVEGERLVGILSDRDVRAAWASQATSLEVRELHYLLDKLQIGSIMTKKVMTATPQMTIEEAARLLNTHRIGCLPVVEGSRLVGIITETDIFAVFVEAMGWGIPSSRLEVVVRDEPGTLLPIVTYLQERRISIASLMSTRHDDPAKRILVLRLRVDDPAPVVNRFREMGLEVLSVLTPGQV